MKTRIIARYLEEEVFDEIGDIDIDNCKYACVVVRSVEAGRQLIGNLEINGIGNISEQYEDEFGWHEIKEYYVSEGIIFDSKTYDKS
jgi:hypothetical protein